MGSILSCVNLHATKSSDDEGNPIGVEKYPFGEAVRACLGGEQERRAQRASNRAGGVGAWEIAVFDLNG